MNTHRIGNVVLGILLLLGMGVVQADQVKLNVALGQPLLPAGMQQTTFLKVGLTGFERASLEKRTPVNLCLVIDRSGSMTGTKIAQAREAARYAVSMLGKDDIISIVTYSSGVSVLVPATKASDKSRIYQAIEQLTADGSTALFAGVSKGAEEVRKFKAKDRVNRVILLSDGLANVGPSSPAELGDLGALLAREGISVTTMGVGLDYNEDLMVGLARRSDGNHAFVENSTDLVRIFKHELGDVLSVVAQDVRIRINCRPGIRPIRVLGRDASIAGQSVTTSLRQIYSNQEKFVILEIDVPAGEAESSRPVADVEVYYANMQTHTTDTLTSALSVRFSHDKELIASSENKEVMVSSVQLVANETNKLALALRDQGKVKEAQKMLLDNASYLMMNGLRYENEELQRLNDYNVEQSKKVAAPEGSEVYKRYRKGARKLQYEQDAQMSY